MLALLHSSCVSTRNWQSAVSRVRVEAELEGPLCPRDEPLIRYRFTARTKTPGFCLDYVSKLHVQNSGDVVERVFTHPTCAGKAEIKLRPGTTHRGELMADRNLLPSEVTGAHDLEVAVVLVRTKGCRQYYGCAYVTVETVLRDQEFGCTQSEGSSPSKGSL